MIDSALKSVIIVSSRHLSNVSVSLLITDTVKLVTVLISASSLASASKFISYSPTSLSAGVLSVIYPAYASNSMKGGRDSF